MARRHRAKWAPSVRRNVSQFSCRYCDNLLLQSQTSLVGLGREIQLSRDHIIVKAYAQKACEEVRNQVWPACVRCNQLRACIDDCAGLTRILIDESRRNSETDPTELARKWDLLDPVKRKQRLRASLKTQLPKEPK